MSWFPLAVYARLCCPCKYECVPNIKSQLVVRLGVVLAFRAPPYTHAHNFFLTWCVQGILDLCKQVRIYLSVEMPNGAKWQRRRLVLKRNLCDGFLSNVVFWSIWIFVNHLQCLFCLNWTLVHFPVGAFHLCRCEHSNHTLVLTKTIAPRPFEEVVSVRFKMNFTAVHLWRECDLTLILTSYQVYVTRLN